MRREGTTFKRLADEEEPTKTKDSGGTQERELVWWSRKSSVEKAMINSSRRSYAVGHSSKMEKDES